MAGDFNKPTTGSLYTAFPTEIRDMFADMAKQFDGTTTSNYPTNTIRWNNANGYWEKYNGATWGALISKYMINVDKVDGYDAGNGNGNIPISNGTVNTNLNADLLDGYNSGNGNGNIPISNGTVNTNLNADKLDGYDAGNASGNVPISNGTRSVNLNADLLDGYEASAFALLSGAAFTGNVTISGTGSVQLANSGDITCYRSGGTTGVIYFGNSGARYLYYNGSNYVMPGATLDVPGGAVYAGGGFQYTSARATKQDIEPVAPGALSRVMKWNVYDYAYKAKPDRRRVGVIADEADSRISTGKAVDIDSAVFELAAAIQELAKQVRQ